MAFGKFVDSFFKGAQHTAAAATSAMVQPNVDDSEDALIARSLEQLRAAVRVAGRDLPTVLTSRLGQIDHLLREVITTIAAQDASTEQRVLLGAMIGDYLPTPLRAFLALPGEDRVDESKATMQFAEQLGILEETIRDLLNQIRIGAIAELSTHGRFLADKFAAPDAGLTLGGN